MATARQQTEEAIYAAWFARMPNSTGERKQRVKEFADAASEVWEPLLREARETIHHERCSTLLHTPDRGLHAEQCWSLGVALGEFEEVPDGQQA